MKTSIKSAGLRMTEAAVLMKVPKATLYRWLAGVDPLDHLHYDYAVKVSGILDAAVKKGYLPVKDVHGADRLPQIRAALKRVVWEEGA